MKIRIYVLMLCTLIFSCLAMAQTGPTGVWQSDLDTGAGQKLNLQIIINKLAGGAYGITVHYMEQDAVKNLTASSVNFDGGKLSFSVDGLGGSFSGTLENKTIAGEWRQGGNAVPMLLTPYKRSKPGSRDIARVLGHWVGEVKSPDGLVMPGVCRFEKTGDGGLVGSVDFPDWGAAKIPIADIWMDLNRLRFRIPAFQATYTGEWTPEGIVGSFEAPGNYESAWNMVRGEYRPSTIGLDIPSEETKKLLGRWVGKMGVVTFIFRFERTPGGKTVGFIDIPQGKVKGIRIYKASLVDGKLFLKIVGMEYTGKLAGNKFDGAMTPMGQNPVPMVVTKE